MRRRTITVATITSVAVTMAVFASSGSALDRPPSVVPGTQDAHPVAASTPAPTPADAGVASASTTEASSYPQSLIDTARDTISVTARAAAATAGTIAETSQQFAHGAYLLGGEFVATGQILGSHIAAMTGLINVPTEPKAAALPAPAAPGPANDAEDLRLSAWTSTGKSNLTPLLGTPASQTLAREPAVSSIRPVPIAGGTSAPRPQIEKVSLDSGSPKGDVTSPTKASAPCTWPALSITESRDAEAATLATLTDLGLMSEPAVRMPDGAVFMPKVAQRLLQVRTGYPCTGGVKTSRSLVGHVIADPTRSGLVQASQPGRVAATDWGLPRLGQRVTEGEILGYLQPIWSNRERAELEAEIATLRGSIAEKELELARSRELPLLPFRQGRILSIRLELDKLRRHRDALIEGLEGAEPILASANGVIARADARVGQVVEVQHLLWEIVDERRLWVEADWFGGQPPKSLDGATAVRADGTSLTLAYEGSGWVLTGQSAPLQFRVDQDASGLRLGERLTVLVHEPVAVPGVLVPRSALVRRGNGETGLWAATAAERFEQFRVRWKPVDGSVVAIEAGLPEGSRVVVSGATLLSEVR